jgi:excisionase family DNA binding protein
VDPKQIRISFRMDRVMVIRRRAAYTVAWCKACAVEATFLTAEEAAAAAGVTTRVIYRWLEEGRIHFSETPEGATLICLNSLPRCRT